MILENNNKFVKSQFSLPEDLFKHFKKQLFKDNSELCKQLLLVSSNHGHCYLLSRRMPEDLNKYFWK